MIDSENIVFIPFIFCFSKLSIVSSRWWVVQMSSTVALRNSVSACEITCQSDGFLWCVLSNWVNCLASWFLAVNIALSHLILFLQWFHKLSKVQLILWLQIFQLLPVNNPEIWQTHQQSFSDPALKLGSL